MRTGHWVEPTRHWSDTSVTHCAVCGRLIPRRSWIFTDESNAFAACSPECEDLYHQYVKPTYGALPVWASGKT
jgi:hypothetical protein